MDSHSCILVHLLYVNCYKVPPTAPLLDMVLKYGLFRKNDPQD